MPRKKDLPSPYDFEKFGAYAHALLDAGAAANIKDAQALARKLIPSEKKIQGDILKHLKTSTAGFWWKDAAGPYQQQGIPDIIGCLDGHFFAFEVKRPLLGELSPMQAGALAKINEAHGSAYVVTGIADVEEALQRSRALYQREEDCV